MKSIKQTKVLGLFAEILLGVVFLAGVVIYATLPSIVRWYIRNAQVEMAPDSYEVIISLLYCVGIPVLALLALAFTLALNITNGRAFVKQNTVLLNLISLCAIIIGLMFFVAMFFLNSVFPIIIFTVFLLLALLTKLFASLFKTAIQYKEENDLTI